MLPKDNYISKKRSITIKGHKTSVTLEIDFWLALKEIAKIKNQSLNKLISEIDKKDPENLSSAIRIFILHFYKN